MCLPFLLDDCVSGSILLRQRNNLFIRGSIRNAVRYIIQVIHAVGAVALGANSQQAATYCQVIRLDNQHNFHIALGNYSLGS